MIYHTVIGKEIQPFRAMRALALLIACLCPLFTAHAALETRYTEERPLVIVSDWDFAPYEFSDNMGQPDGYNVELLDLILDRLKIPHVFRLREWFQAVKAFENHEADLINAIASIYQGEPYIQSKYLMSSYVPKVAIRKDNVPFGHLSSLTPEDTLLLIHEDYADVKIKSRKGLQHNSRYSSPKDALAAISSGQYRYFIWGEMSIRWKLHQLHLDNIRLVDVDIPGDKLCFIGYDRELIDAIDNMYIRLEQAGELTAIRDKWFHPERVHNDSSPLALLILVGVLIAGIVGFLLSRLIVMRVKTAVNQANNLNLMMNTAVSQGNVFVTEHDLLTGHIHNLYRDLLPPEGMTIQQFIDCFHPTKRQQYNEFLHKLKTGTIQQVDINASWCSPSGQWLDLRGKCILEYDVNGHPRFVVNTLEDVTQEISEESNFRELSNKYAKLFDSNLIPMSFYDNKGQIIDLNEGMRELCNFSGEGEQYFRGTSMFDMPLIRGEYTPVDRETFHVCQRMNYEAAHLDKYIDIEVKPILDEKGDVQHYIVTSRDVTSERELHLNLKKQDRELHKKADTINSYEKQLFYLLSTNDMWVWSSDRSQRKLYFSQSLMEVQHTMTFEEYTKAITGEDSQEIQNTILDDEKMCVPFNVVHHFLKKKDNWLPEWAATSGMPQFDANGHLTGHLGIMRDVSELMRAQEQLRQETLRAEDSSRLKSAFLANMTHEIRTPLNAIVGFSALFSQVDSQDDRHEFIRIIRNNSDILLRLINDILVASNMKQALEFKMKDVDFAKAFDDICQTLSQRVQQQQPGVSFLKDNPYPTLPIRADVGRIQQILTNFVTNAIKYTKEGHIRVGYHKKKNGIYLYCEDTGAGIAKEQQAAIFDRFVKLNEFVQGTGLGLSICKHIAERCGGKIGIISEGEGKGSTFWFWFPLEESEDHE